MKNPLISTAVLISFSIIATGCGLFESSDDEIQTLRAELVQLREDVLDLETEIELLAVAPPQPEPLVVTTTTMPEAEDVQVTTTTVQLPTLPSIVDTVVDNSEVEAILTASYQWGPSSITQALQTVLEIEADGWYGAVTREAHLAALEEKGFPAEGVPDEEPLPCPPQDPMPDSEAIPMASIVLDMDGDGNTEAGQTYYNWDLEVFYAQVSGSGFGPYWVELDDIGTAPANQWKASFGTDINTDNRSEFWVRQIPFGASTVGYRVLIFEDCELKIAYIPDSNELFIDGGTVGTSWRIACELEDGVPVIVQYEIVVGAVEGEGSLTGMVYQLSSTGFTFITVRNLETFEDPGGPYGTDCESWIHDPPPWIES